MRKTKIVTHAGKAHRDDFLSCCAILFHAYRQGMVSYIERRLVGDYDLRCKDTWVVDTGGCYSPELKNFDHHQQGAPPGLCSLDMVLGEILGDVSYATYRRHSPWLRTTSAHDNAGSQGASASLGLSVQNYYATRSPIETCMLNAFGEMTVIHPESPLSHTMREIGRFLLSDADEMTTAMEDRLQAVPPPFYHAGLKVWDVRSAWGTGSDSLTSELVKRQASARSVDLIIGKSNRSGGISLYRTGWASTKLDLAKLRDTRHVTFTHNNGFYAVVASTATSEELTAIITAASNLKGRNEHDEQEAADIDQGAIDLEAEDGGAGAGSQDFGSIPYGDGPCDEGEADGLAVPTAE